MREMDFWGDIIPFVITHALEATVSNVPALVIQSLRSSPTVTSVLEILPSFSGAAMDWLIL